MPGGELARELVRIRPELRVVFMSGFHDSEMVRLMVMENAVAFLAKPFHPEGLIEVVNHALDQPPLEAPDPAPLRAYAAG
ncbi:MAG: response regulator, partial [Alphaproteobacteria bacterium]|nr:response regulator [Alphaproteobacteria bacterium]